jgi:tetratricopeptide (TPR) repeat protein
MYKLTATFLYCLVANVLLAQDYDCISKESVRVISNIQDFDQKIAAWNQALKDCPNNEKALYWRAIAYTYGEKQNHLLAIADFERVLLLNPKDCKIYPILAYEYGIVHKTEKQLEIYNRQIEQECKVNGGVYKSRAWVNAELGRYNVAMSDYDVAEAWYLKNEPQDIWSLYYSKAFAYCLMSKYAEAIQLYLRCEADMRKHMPAMLENYYRYRAAAYYGNEQTDKAFEDIEKAALLNPNYGAPIALRAHINRSLGNEKEAAKDWKQAIDIHQLNSGVDSLDQIYTQYAGNKPINTKTEIGEQAIKKAMKSAKHSKIK